MPETPERPDAETSTPEFDSQALLQSLRRKEGNWVEWGQSCQRLQKAGLNPQHIFEETGFEPIQQNQVIVAAQVYASLVTQGVPEAVQAHYSRKGSDVLYELRILTQADRASVATLVFEKNLDMDEAREVARSVKDFSRLPEVPEGYTTHPGDAVAYQCWKLARQKSDLQERSRLIARGLKFAHSETARRQIEQLLTDFTVVPAKSSPRLPVYRLESEDEMPRVLPVVGKFPLSTADFKAVPFVEETGPFRLVQFTGSGVWLAVPGWRVILAAEDPVAILCDSDQLPTPLTGEQEEVLVIIDRAQRDWNASSYFLVDRSGQLELQWFETAPEFTILGQLIVVMRPKKVLDENLNKDLWFYEE